MKRKSLGLLIVPCFFAGTASAQEPLPVSLPIACTLGTDCVIQNYVDRDPGPGAADFRCGHLTYDGHKGTDFRLLDLAQMRRGVAVRVAAAGRVVGVRNDMADVDVREIGVSALAGRDCGNGARIDHGNGWVSQYCHLRKGSVRVKRGDRARAGQFLGEVGLSGRTQFPHLHFELSRDAVPVDPFVGPRTRTGCRVTEEPLWRAAPGRVPGYHAVGELNAGFDDRPPSMVEIENGGHRKTTLRPTAPALVFWVRLFGVGPNDNQRITIFRPDGSILFRSEPRRPDRPKAQWMIFGGKRRPASGAWPKGTYRGEYILERNGRAAVSISRDVTIR